MHNARALHLSLMIISQDEQLTQSLTELLHTEGFQVSSTTDGGRALKLIAQLDPDFIILDRMIAPIGGIRVCRKILTESTQTEVQIIMIGLSNDPADRIQSFDAGASAYLSRPVDAAQLLASVSDLKLRRRFENAPSELKAGEIEMVLDSWSVSVSGTSVDLTLKEFRLLEELLTSKGKVLTRDTLLERVWGHSNNTKLQTRTVDVHIGRLRKKLGPSGDSILTIRNVGYRVNMIGQEWTNHQRRD